MKKQNHPLRTRLTALLLALFCVLGLFPATALAAGDTIRLTDFGMSGVAYQSNALGRCTLHQMYFSDGSSTTTGFCGTKGGGMGNSLKGQTWGNKSEISDATVKTMMAYYYAHSTGVFTDEAKALSVDDVWDPGYTWYMNAWVQAVVWRYKEGSLNDPVTSCAEEYLAVYNSLEGTHYTSIDEELDGRSFRDRVQYILDLGSQGVWGDCKVYEYSFTGTGSSSHPASSVQKIVLGELTVPTGDTQEKYTLIVKKVDATNPNKGLSGAGFHIQSENGSFSQDVITGADGTYTLKDLNPGTFAITETIAPSGYEIDSTGPQYVTLPSNGNNTVTVTFRDTPPPNGGEGTIRKVDADDPTKGLAGAVIKITGIDNSFTGTYVTVDGGYLTDVPWDSLPTGSFVAEEVTPPEGYSKSPDQSKVKQTFQWDGQSEVALVFENDSKVKVQLLKKDDSDNPLPGAVFNIIKDGQIVGTEATGPDGTITVTDVTEGMYAFVEVSAPAPYATLREPVFAHVDQATINGGGTVTVTASDKKLPNLTILKRDAQTGAVIPDTHFEIKGIHYGYHDDVTTGPDGTATLTGIPVDSYEVTEKSVPDPYVVGDEPTQTIWLEPGDSKQLVFDNMKQPLLKITKIEKGTGTPIPGTVFLIEAIDGDYRQNVTTEAGGSVELRVAPGSYRITEQSVPSPFVISDEPTKTISLNPGDEKEVIFENLKKPELTISKIDADTGGVIPGTVFTVKALDGDYKDDWTTGADGKVSKRVDPGTYQITEKSVPSPYYLPDNDADRVQTISLNAGDEKTVLFRNHKAPELTIFKEDSVAGAPIEGAKFHVTFTSNGEAAEAPASFDFGYLFTDARGEIRLHEQGQRLYPGQYTITEVAPAPGFQMKEPTTQTVIIHGGESKTVTFQNEPLNAIIVEKYDSVTHEALPGCTFQLRYLGGTSGTGGTVIGQKVTGKNGTCIWTGLQAGTYIVEEVDPADGYSIIQASETVYLADNGEQSVITVRFDNAPDGILLIRKVCAVNPGTTLQDAEFKIMYADGTLIGDSNGIYVTDENGEIRIPGLKPGKSVVVTETRAPAGFMIDTQSQTVQIKEGRTVSLTFKNQPKGSLIIQKRDSITGQPLPGAEFRVTTAAGCEVGLDGVIGDATLTQNGLFTTDSNGEIRISNLAPGALVITEVRAPDGYIMDSPSTNVVIGSNGDTQTVVITNTPKGGLLIRKIDSVTGVALPGVKFKITAANGELVPDNEGQTSSNGIYVTDENGQIYLKKLNPNTYVVTEIETIDGYLLDAMPQTVVVDGADTQVLTFTNMPLGGLLVKKMDAATKEPLADVIFKITRTDGTVVGNSNGEFRTDERGYISLPDLEPGSYLVREVQAKPGFLLDDTVHAIEIKDHQTYTLEVFNQPLGSLIINKLSSFDNSPLEGVKFQLKYSNGQVVDNRNGQVSSNGIYYTDKNGQIIVSGITGTVVATELETILGYTIDPNTRTQTVVINPNDTQTLNFYNTPTTTLVIRKFIEGTEYEPLAGICFKVTDGSGAAVGPDDGIYYTDKSGEITLVGIEPGTVVIAREVKSVEGFVLDGTPQDIKIEAGPVQRLTFWNKKAGTLVIEKRDSVSGELIPGAQFELTYANGGYVDNDNGHLSSNGLYTTDANGQIRISGITGTVVCKEVQAAPGYVIDQSTQVQTVVVNPMDTQTLTFLNEPLCSLTLTKLDSVTGKPVPNTEFVVKDSNGNVVGRYVTGKDGTVVVTGLIPGATYQVFESRVPDGYVLDPTPQIVTVRNGANTVTSGVAGGGSGTSSGTGTGTGGSGNNGLTFENDPTTTLVIEKYITGTTTPIKGVTFLVTDSSGAVIGSSNGEYITDENGRIVIEGLEPGVTVSAREIRTIEGYILDTTPKTIKIKVGEAQTLRFYNDPMGTLVIRKLDSVTGEPLAGVEFELTYAEGGFVDDANGHLSSKGRYTTNDAGEIRISGIVGTVVVKEVKCLPGYTMDPGTQTQTVVVNSADTQTLTFYNTPIGGLELIKVSESDKSQRIPNVKFEIRKMDGGLVTTVITDSTGRVHVDLDAGNYCAVEIEAGKGFMIDSTPQYFTIEDGKTTTLTVTNRPVSGILIHKIDSITKEGIYGVTFLLYDANKNPIGQYTSDDSGYVYIDDLPDSGRYYLREMENEGYIVDTQLKTVYVSAGTTTEITWENTAITGQIQITKTSEDYNSMNGWAAGTPIPGTEFEIYHYRTGNLVDTIRTDKNGVAVSKPLPLGRYQVIESKAADFYGLDKTPIDVEIEHAGQIVKAAMTNKSLYTNVSIKKTGYVEVMPGQEIRYDISDIANNSTTVLTSFYWRDTLPVQAVRLSKIVTGTYNVQGNYKIVFKTNLNGEYRTMYDNLSTMQNNVLDASPVALGLAANEYVTEFMVSFGVVPANFRQVEAPRVYCNVVSWLTGGTQFANQADVGGVYNGQWIMATSRWVTSVYKPSKPLPRTGY